MSLRILLFSLFAIFLLFVCGSAGGAAGMSCELVTETRTTKSGVTYTLYPQGKLKFDFLVDRPMAKNSNILLCVPSAFTTQSNEVDGIAVSNGVVKNRSARNPNLGGAAIIRNGQIALISSDKGQKLTGQLISDLQKTKGSMYQQFLIVDNARAASFKDKSNFQRRAVYQKLNGFGVIESDRSIDFSTFNNDLVELGVKNALYCDMGAWDEGWHRRNLSSKARVIGLDRSQTARQSNWLVLRCAENESQKQRSGVKLGSVHTTPRNRFSENRLRKYNARKRNP